MKLADLVKNYSFHDSGILDVHYLQAKNTLILSIAFSNWVKWINNDQSEPEVYEMLMVFTGVKRYTISPPGASIIENEILCMNLLDVQFEASEAIEIGIRGGPEGWMTMEIVAEDARLFKILS